MFLHFHHLHSSQVDDHSLLFHLQWLSSVFPLNFPYLKVLLLPLHQTGIEKINDTNRLTIQTKRIFLQPHGCKLENRGLYYMILPGKKKYIIIMYYAKHKFFHRKINRSSIMNNKLLKSWLHLRFKQIHLIEQPKIKKKLQQIYNHITISWNNFVKRVKWT